MPLVLAITGGIASGKTLATRHLESLGVEVVDADVIARDVVTPESEALNQISQALGSALIDEHGHLRRDQLRQLIFSDQQARQKLEGILHPLIRQAMREQVNTASGPYVAVAIPLLAERIDSFDWIDRILVIDASIEITRRRVQQRDQVDADAAQAVIDAQSSRSSRLAIAHDVLINDGDKALLCQNASRLHHSYLSSIKRSGSLNWATAS